MRSLIVSTRSGSPLTATSTVPGARLGAFTSAFLLTTFVIFSRLTKAVYNSWLRWFRIKFTSSVRTEARSAPPIWSRFAS